MQTLTKLYQFLPRLLYLNKKPLYVNSSAKSLTFIDVALMQGISCQWSGHIHTHTSSAADDLTSRPHTERTCVVVSVARERESERETNIRSSCPSVRPLLLTTALTHALSRVMTEPRPPGSRQINYK